MVVKVEPLWGDSILGDKEDHPETGNRLTGGDSVGRKIKQESPPCPNESEGQCLKTGDTVGFSVKAEPEDPGPEQRRIFVWNLLANQFKS